MGFQFKIPLSAALAVVKGIQTVSTIILAAGDITTILLTEAVANGILLGLSYYKERQPAELTSRASHSKQLYEFLTNLCYARRARARNS